MPRSIPSHGRSPSYPSSSTPPERSVTSTGRASPCWICIPSRAMSTARRSAKSTPSSPPSPKSPPGRHSTPCPPSPRKTCRDSPLPKPKPTASSPRILADLRKRKRSKLFATRPKTSIRKSSSPFSPLRPHNGSKRPAPWPRKSRSSPRSRSTSAAATWQGRNRRA